MKKATIYRLILLFVLIIGLALLAKLTPLGNFFTLAHLKTTMREAGWIGVLFFVLAFILGTVMNIPGIVFIVAALLVYGFAFGIPIAFSGAFFSVVVHFLVVRTIGGKALDEIQNSFIKKMMGKLEDQPIRTVVVLRLLFFISPPVNIALALTGLRLSDFMIGTLVGMVLPMSFVTGVVYFAQDVVVGWFT